MLSKTAAAAAFIGVMGVASVALAFNSPAPTPSGARPAAFASEFGKTLPPIGFVKLCTQHPTACAVRSTPSDKRLVMTAAKWQLVNNLNAYVNHKIAPVSDQDLYGQAEYWTYPVDAGDCEDYVLLKQRYLSRLGVPDSALLITVVLDEKKEGHAVLTLATSEGDFILDNRVDEVRSWSATKYTYLKRQSQQDPRQWVALIEQKSKTQPTVASRP